MIYLYIFALLIHAACSNACQDGQISSRETSNPEDLLGKWTYVYHWDNQMKYPNEFADSVDRSSQADCPEMQIAAIAPDFVKSKVVECAKDKIPFNWDDAKLRLDAPAMNMNGSIIAMGEKDNWLMVDCNTFVRVAIRMVSDEYVVMSNRDDASASEMIARKTPSLEELKCVVHNMDVVKDMKGIGLCYKN